jgi:hypothetical protein
VFRGQEEIFFAILRSIVWGTSVDVPFDVNWQKVLHLAARQKCLHAFSIWLKQHRIVTPYDKHLQQSMLRLMGRHVRLNQLAVDVVTLLSQHDIPATLIKGCSIAALYPDADMRDFGDVDIYVGEQYYHQAAQIVTEAYPEAYWHSDIRGGIHYILVLDEYQERVVELHRVTMEFYDKKADAMYQAFTDKYLRDEARIKHLDVGGVPLAVPSAAYNALYVFMHAWHHFESTGVGLRQLADWALCLKCAHDELSSEEWVALCGEIEAILSPLRMKRAWQTFGHVLVDVLHLPAEVFPLYTKAYARQSRRLLRQLLRDGHCGRTAQFSWQEMCLMRRIPWERPENNRLLQLMYTGYKVLFDAWQMAKLFPDFAWSELVAKLRHIAGKRR